jgi:hypothetical protein
MPYPTPIEWTPGPWVEFGYSLCFRGDWIGNLWSRIWYRWYCPYPIIDDCSVRACIAAGHCGCDNNPNPLRIPQHH